MKTWDSKLVTFLSNGNVIIVNNENEYKDLQELMASIGLDLFQNRYTFDQLVVETLRDAERHNREYEFGNRVAIEYSNGKGFMFGWKSEVQCEDWFGIKPFSFQEILEEIQN